MLHVVGYLVGLFAGAVALAIAFRRLRVPGGAVLAGAVVGLLMGPTLLGRLAPDWFEKTVIGGQEERQSLDSLVGEYEARELARREMGISNDPEVRDLETREFIANHERADQAWREAQWRDQEPLRWTAIVCAGLFLLAAGLTRPVVTGSRPHLYQMCSIAVWSAILPGALFLVILRWMDVELSMAFIASSAIAAGAVIFARGDLDAADEAETGGARLIIAASRIALLFSVLTFVVLAALASSPSVLVLLAAPLICYAIGLLAPRTSRALVVSARDYVLIPILTALLAVRIEFFEHLSLWMIVAAMILSGDGRWFGAYLGAMFSGVRRSLRTMRLVLGVMSAGTTQIALATILVHAGLIAEEPAYALLAGAIVMEITTNARRRMARRIEKTEEEFHDARVA